MNGAKKFPEMPFTNKKSTLMQLVERSPVPETIVFSNKIAGYKMQNALTEYLNSKMTQSFGQSDNLLQHDPQYQALVSSFLNGNSAGSISSFVDESLKCQQTSHLDQSYSLMHKMKQEEQCVFIGNPQLPLKEQNP